MALISQAEFSRKIGVSKPYIHKLVKKGIIKLRNGKVDTAQAMEAMKANTDPANLLREENPPEVIPAGGKAAGAVDFITTRTMREAFKAKLEYEEKNRKLTDASKVSNDAFKTGRIIRDELLAIPDRLADVLAAEDDPGEVRKVIFDELELALNRISIQGWTTQTTAANETGRVANGKNAPLYFISCSLTKTKSLSKPERKRS